MNPYEAPFAILFLLVLRHTCMIACIRPLRGLLGVSGVMVLSLAVSLWLYPVTILDAESSLLQEMSLVSLIIKEVVLGVGVGLVCALFFEVLPFVGRLIDTFRGVQFAEQIAPELGPRDSLLESYGGYFTLWFFFAGLYAREWVALLSLVEETFPVIKVPESTALNLFHHRSLLESFVGDFFTISLIVVMPLVLLSLSFELLLSVLQKLNTKFSLGVELSLLRGGMGVFFLCYLLYSGTQAPKQLHQLTASGFEMLKNFLGSA